MMQPMVHLMNCSTSFVHLQQPSRAWYESSAPQDGALVHGEVTVITAEITASSNPAFLPAHTVRAIEHNTICSTHTCDRPGAHACAVPAGAG